MSWGRALARSLQQLVPSGSGSTVLCYHLVDGGTDSAVEISREAFRLQLTSLLEHAEPFNAARWTPSSPSKALSPAAVALTFDDAFENFYQVAYPVLEELGLSTLLFVPVGFVEGECGSPLAGAERLPAMTWNQLREVTRRGTVEVGSHSWTHPDLRRLDSRALRRELVDSRDRLQEELGAPVRTFCYPKALWSRRVEQEVAEAYDVAFVAGGRRGGGRSNPLRVSRIPIRRDMPESLAEVVRPGVWLEEWMADKVRRYLRRS